MLGKKRWHGSPRLPPNPTACEHCSDRFDEREWAHAEAPPGAIPSEHFLRAGGLSERDAPSQEQCQTEPLAPISPNCPIQPPGARGDALHTWDSDVPDIL